MALNNSPEIVSKLARSAFVVLMRVNGKLTVAIDPATKKVWSGQGIFGRRMGDEIVKDAEASGYTAEVRTWAEAFDLLLKEYGGESLFTKALYDRMVAQQQAASNITLPPKSAS